MALVSPACVCSCSCAEAVRTEISASENTWKAVRTHVTMTEPPKFERERYWDAVGICVRVPALASVKLDRASNSRTSVRANDPSWRNSLLDDRIAEFEER